jgi:hypothetical protein
LGYKISIIPLRSELLSKKSLLTLFQCKVVKKKKEKKANEKNRDTLDDLSVNLTRVNPVSWLQ